MIETTRLHDNYGGEFEPDPVDSKLPESNDECIVQLLAVVSSRTATRVMDHLKFESL